MKLSFSNLCTHSFYQVKISPNAHYVANVIGNRVVIRRLERNLSIVHVFENAKTINYMQWSPNSECILTINYDISKIQIHSVKDRKWTATIRDPVYPIASVQWTSDSKSIMCTTEMGLRVSIWNLSKKEQRHINYTKFYEKAIETSPDGKYVAVVHKRSGKDTLSIYHSASFVLLESFEVGTVDLENIKWSPDSSCLAVWDNCLYNTLIIYRPDGYICTTYNGYEFGLGIKMVNWSQNGKFLAIGNHDQTIHLLSTMSWSLITVLEHPSVLNNQTADIALFEEINLLKSQESNNKTRVSYQKITKRPFNIPMNRSEYSQPNPRVGVGSCQFSKDGLYLASRSDNMPTVLWIWNLNTLTCSYVIMFKNIIKQLMWNPGHEHLLAIHCGDHNIHFVKLTKGVLDVVPSAVDTSDFTIRKARWGPDGNTLLLLDQQLFCLAETLP